MQHALLKHLGETIIGKPEGPFAVYDEQLNAILIFGATKQQVRHTSLTGNASESLMRAAHRMKADFNVHQDRTVVCRVGASKATGDSYASAALRAIIAHLDTSQSSGQGNPA